MAPRAALDNYNTSIATAETARQTVFNQAVTTEQAGFDLAAITAAGAIGDGLSPMVDALIANRISQVNALFADATNNPGSHPNLSFEVTNIVGFYRSRMFDTILLAVYESNRAPLSVRPGVLPSAVDAASTYFRTLADLTTAYFANRDSAEVTRMAAVTAAGVAYSAASQAAEDQLPVARAAYNASMVASVPVFYSNGDNNLRGVPLAMRLPTSNGGAVVALRRADVAIPGGGDDGEGGTITARVEYGGVGAGFEVRSSTGAIVATASRDNALPMPDGTYLVHQGGNYDVYKLNGTYVRSEGLGYGESGIVIPNRVGGFSVLQVASASQVNYTKDVPAYTRLRNVAGSAGPTSSFATRPGAAPGDFTPPPAVPPPAAPLVVFGGGSGATFAGVSGCNGSVCSAEVLVARALLDAQRAAAAVDRLIEIDAQRAAAAVRALQTAEQARRADPNAGPVTAGMVVRDYGEAERLTQQIAEFYKTATPAQIRDTAAAAQTVLTAWAEREALTQRLGANPADPNEMRQVDMILNMAPAQRVEYFERKVAEMRLGTDP